MYTEERCLNNDENGILQHHKALGQVWIEMARDLADSLILPFNVSDYANVLQDMGDTLLLQFGKLMDDNDIKTGTPEYEH